MSRTTKNTQAENIQDEAAVMTAAPQKSKTVRVMLPRDPLKKGQGADQEFFSVNFKNYLIKTDEYVEVPEEVAEVIKNVAKARLEARKYIEQNAFKDSKPAT